MAKTNRAESSSLLSVSASDADRALGRVDGVATILPNLDLFVAMNVKHEAVFSSQIEGTQGTLEMGDIMNAVPGR